MAINFPANPVNGQTLTQDGLTFRYDAISQSWEGVVRTQDKESPVFVSNSAPSSPMVGALWYDLSNSTLFLRSYSTGVESWVPITSSQTPLPPYVVVSATEPSDPAQGSLWYDSITSDLKIRSGSSWILAFEDAPEPVVPTVAISSSAPISPDDGSLWYNLNTEELYVWSDNSNNWVEIVSPGNFVQTPPTTISDSPPLDPRNGDLWIDSRDMDLHVYYDDGDTSQWVSLTAYTRNVFDEPIYANYSIPSAPNAFVTVEWVQERLGAEGSVPLSALSSKGSLISASAPYIAEEVPPGFEGTLLRRNDSSPSGIDWVQTLDGGNF